MANKVRTGRQEPHPIFPPKRVRDDAWPFDEDVFGTPTIDSPNGDAWDKALMPTPLKGKIWPYNDY